MVSRLEEDLAGLGYSPHKVRALVSHVAYGRTLAFAEIMEGSARLSALCGEPGRAGRELSYASGARRVGRGDFA